MDFAADFGEAEAPLVMSMRETAPGSKPLQRRQSTRKDHQKPKRGSGLFQSLGALPIEEQLEVTRASLQAAREQLSIEIEAKYKAAQRVQELELERLGFQEERKRWRQREAELLGGGAGTVNVPRSERTSELEVLLREALKHGAELGRLRELADDARDDAEQRLRRFKDAARGKLHRERRRGDAARARANLAEQRLGEYLEASIGGVDSLVEAHVRHLVDVGHALTRKAAEQADIIEVLRGLLQDHKDFIRQELSDAEHQPELQAPDAPGAGGGRSAWGHTALDLPPAVHASYGNMPCGEGSGSDIEFDAL